MYPLMEAVRSGGDLTKVGGEGKCCGDGISLFSEINRYTLEDAEVELFYHLQVAGGSYERIPMGIFEVSEAKRKAKCLEIKAYDYMVRFAFSEKKLDKLTIYS